VALLLAVLTAFAAIVALAVPGGARAAVPHRTGVLKSTVQDSNDKGISASCSGGQHVVGSGADVEGPGAPYVILDQLIPTETSVSAYAYEWENGTSLVWFLRVWAICADPPAGDLTKTVTQGVQSPGSPVNRVVTATCPAGTVLYATGWQIEGARGEVMVDHVIPTATSVEVSAYEVDGGITSGYSGNWSLSAIARCAPEPGGRQIVATDSAHTSDDKFGTATCPNGKVSLGGGYEVHGLRDRIMVNYLAPATPFVTTHAYELIDVSPGTWYLTTYDICATE
jgi:hypothetical protein